MLIFAIDDEQAPLDDLHRAISEAEPDAEVRDFRYGEDVLEALDTGILPDVVFSDIRLPGMDGLHLAARIKEAAPEARIVFVTAYSEYAVEAYRRHINGYVMKPVDAAAVRDELDHLPEPRKAEREILQVQCFGRFEVFWHDEPIAFERRQTKELLAFLVDREGAFVTAEEAISVLWEDETDIKAAKHRMRNLVLDLKKTLSRMGIEGVILRRSGLLAVQRDQVDCDYYRMLQGDMSAVNAFRGEYMEQYSWAELTRGKLYFRGNR